MSNSGNVKVPVWVASILLVAAIGWLSWVSIEIIGLKSDMSAVKEFLQMKTAIAKQ